MDDKASNICSILVDLSTTMKDTALKIVLQNTVRLLSNMNIPEGILVERAETVQATDQPEIKDEAHTVMYKVCIPSPAALRDENDCTKTLVALVYFKIRKHFLEGAHQFKFPAYYPINQNGCQKFSMARNISAGSSKQ